jgi:hypothetical protein
MACQRREKLERSDERVAHFVLPVWEDANDRGLVRTEEVEGRLIVRITARRAACCSPNTGAGSKAPPSH